MERQKKKCLKYLTSPVRGMFGAGAPLSELRATTFPVSCSFVCTHSVDAAWADNLVEKWNETHGLSLPPPPSPHRQAEQAHCKLHFGPQEIVPWFLSPPSSSSSAV